ncbi:MAG TPA: hypothetical protein VN665_00505 [Candidatus Paceibacterota bacterium]|nr:hypothetical protein [Candidatus Paceibacterota bacterium]
MEKDQDNHLNTPGSEEKIFGKVVGYIKDDDKPVLSQVTARGVNPDGTVHDDGYVPSY